MADDVRRSIDEVLNKLPPEDADRILKTVANTAVEAVEARIPHLFNSIREMLGLTDTVLTKVEEISRETGDTKEDLLLKALLLYQEALDANQKGQRLVVVEPDYRYIKEIVGLKHVDREPVQSGNSAK